jgi:two-component system NtrC family sensor kinase
LGLALLIVADVAIVVLFGLYLMNRLVVAPLERLNRAADAIASGELDVRAPGSETKELTELAERFNHMTDRLLDAQNQLVRAEKLASLGHLSAGIAHEVGNPLSAIANYVELMRRRGADPEMLDGVDHEIERIDRIVRSLLAYARPRDEAPSPVDPGPVLESVLELLRRQGATRSVALRSEIAQDLPAVRAKPQLVEQVVVNLLLNAVEAAPGGTVTLGASRWRYERADEPTRRRTDPDVGAPPARRFGATPPIVPRGTPGVLIWVTDSGPGVPAADRDKIFEPFYTTKEPGRGTGLGLAIVQRVVYEAGGAVWVDAAREGGAAFKVFIPAEAA